MRRTYTIISISILILFAVIVYKNYNMIPNEISPSVARDNVRLGNYEYIVDVRTSEEWNEEHSPNTISIPIGEFVTELPRRVPDKNAKILFVCKKGIRASGVVTIAHKLGYNNVQAMIGNYKELEQ